MSTESELKMGMKCVKYMIFVANFMFMLVGLLLISIGCTIKAIYEDFDLFLSSDNHKASNFAIGVGVVIIIVALFGCVGALRQSVCLVNLYAFCLLLIVVLEIAVSITAYNSRTDIEMSLRRGMLFSMDYYKRDNDTNYLWTAVQNSLYCCGVDGPQDWNQYGQDYNLTRVNYTYDNHFYMVPNSCCYQEVCTDSGSLYYRGCYYKLRYIVSQSALLLGVGALCITFIQLLGAIFAHLLARSIRKLKSQMEVERTLRRQQLYEQLSQAQQMEKKASPVLYVPTSSEA